jgi:hypothetical protein
MVIIIVQHIIRYVPLVVLRNHTSQNVGNYKYAILSSFFLYSINDLMASDHPVQMDLDELEIEECRNSRCDCKKLLTNLKQIKQENFGMCWFVSVINTMLISERLNSVLKPYLVNNNINICSVKPKNVARHLDSDVSGQSCLPSMLDFKTMFHLYREINSQLFGEILKDYVNDEVDYCKFGCENSNSGGIPFKILVPYIIRLGFPACDVKHVIFNFYRIQQTLPTLQPRSLKFNRLFIDYLITMARDNKVLPKIFICTQLADQDSNNRDILSGNTAWYTGKYICFIAEDPQSGRKVLVVYTLDCGILTSNNNTGRGSGHAICMLSCKNKGYIVNSYLPQDGTSPLKSCSVYHYNWQKWQSHDYFYHTIDNDIHCGKGSILLHRPGSTLDAQTLHTRDPKFMYHKNVGINSLIYVKDAYPIHDIDTFDNIHDADHFLHNVFDNFLKPYFVLINYYVNNDLFQSISFSGYIDSFKHSVMCNHPTSTIILHKQLDPDEQFHMIQKGIVKNDMQVAVYKINNSKNITRFGELLFDCVPDDIMILQSVLNENEYYIIVQYFRGVRTEEEIQLREAPMIDARITTQREQLVYGGKSQSKTRKPRKQK